jgi:hypothetical protein
VQHDLRIHLSRASGFNGNPLKIFDQERLKKFGIPAVEPGFRRVSVDCTVEDSVHLSYVVKDEYVWSICYFDFRIDANS